MCLLDYDVVRRTLEPVAGALRGRSLVDLTNGTPAQAVDFAARAAGHAMWNSPLSIRQLRSEKG